MLRASDLALGHSHRTFVRNLSFGALDTACYPDLPAGPASVALLAVCVGGAAAYSRLNGR